MHLQPVQVQKSDQPHPSYMHFDGPGYECLSLYLHSLTPDELQIKHTVVQQELTGDLDASRIVDLFSAAQCREKVCESLKASSCSALLELDSIFANARNLSVRERITTHFMRWDIDQLQQVQQWCLQQACAEATIKRKIEELLPKEQHTYFFTLLDTFFEECTRYNLAPNLGIVAVIGDALHHATTTVMHDPVVYTNRATSSEEDEEISSDEDEEVSCDKTVFDSKINSKKLDSFAKKFSEKQSYDFNKKWKAFKKDIAKKSINRVLLDKEITEAFSKYLEAIDFNSSETAPESENAHSGRETAKLDLFFEVIGAAQASYTGYKLAAYQLMSALTTTTAPSLSLFACDVLTKYRTYVVCRSIQQLENTRKIHDLSKYSDSFCLGWSPENKYSSSYKKEEVALCLDWSHSDFSLDAMVQCLRQAVQNVEDKHNQFQRELIALYEKYLTQNPQELTTIATMLRSSIDALKKDGHIPLEKYNSLRASFVSYGVQLQELDMDANVEAALNAVDVEEKARDALLHLYRNIVWDAAAKTLSTTGACVVLANIRGSRFDPKINAAFLGPFFTSQLRKPMQEVFQRITDQNEARQLIKLDGRFMACVEEEALIELFCYEQRGLLLVQKEYKPHLYKYLFNRWGGDSFKTRSAYWSDFPFIEHTRSAHIDKLILTLFISDIQETNANINNVEFLKFVFVDSVQDIFQSDDFKDLFFKIFNFGLIFQQAPIEFLAVRGLFPITSVPRRITDVGIANSLIKINPEFLLYTDPSVLYLLFCQQDFVEYFSNNERGDKLCYYLKDIFSNIKILAAHKEEAQRLIKVDFALLEKIPDRIFSDKNFQLFLLECDWNKRSKVIPQVFLKFLKDKVCITDPELAKKWIEKDVYSLVLIHEKLFSKSDFVRFLFSVENSSKKSSIEDKTIKEILQKKYKDGYTTVYSTLSITTFNAALEWIKEDPAYAEYIDPRVYENPDFQKELLTLDWSKKSEIEGDKNLFSFLAKKLRITDKEIAKKYVQKDILSVVLVELGTCVFIPDEFLEFLSTISWKTELEVDWIRQQEYARILSCARKMHYISKRGKIYFVIEDEKVARQLVAYDPVFLSHTAVSFYANKDFQAFLLSEDWSKESKIKEGTTLFTILQPQAPITDLEFAIACIRKDVCALQLIDLTLLSQMNFVNFLVTLNLDRASSVIPYKKASHIVYQYWRISDDDEPIITDKECAKKLVSYDPAFLSGVPEVLRDKDYQTFLLGEDWSKESKLKKGSTLFTILQSQATITDLEFAIACINKDICALQIIDKNLFSNIDFVDFLVTLDLDKESKVMLHKSVSDILYYHMETRSDRIFIYTRECAEKLVSYDQRFAWNIRSVLYADAEFQDFLFNSDWSNRSKIDRQFPNLLIRRLHGKFGTLFHLTNKESAKKWVTKDIYALHFVDKNLFSNIDFVDFLVTLSMDAKSNSMPDQTVLKIISHMIQQGKISIDNVECAEKLINYDPALARTIRVNNFLYTDRFMRFLISCNLNKKTKLNYDYRLSHFIQERYRFKSNRNIRFKFIGLYVLLSIINFIVTVIEKVKNFLEFLISG